jgi:hypothetical protein
MDGVPLLVWSRGWEYRTVVLLQDIFGDALFVDYHLKNDVFFVESDNPGVSTVTLTSLRAEYHDWIEDGVACRHQFDHQLHVPEGLKEEFISKLSTVFGAGAAQLSAYWSSFGDVNVVIETKSFLRASVQPKEEDDDGDWYDRMIANATTTLAVPETVYLVMNWTESSCTLYVVDNEGKMNVIGSILYVATVSDIDRDQAQRNHMRGYSNCLETLPCPSITVERKGAVPQPFQSAYRGIKKGIFITTTEKPKKETKQMKMN